MTTHQNSDDTEAKHGGFLTNREREYLEGELEVGENGDISKDYEYTIKSRIRKKSKENMADFALVYDGLPDKDINKIWSESVGSDDGIVGEERGMEILQSAQLHGSAVADIGTMRIISRLVRKVMVADDKILAAFDVMTDVFSDYRTKEEIIQYIEETWPETDE